MVLILGGLGAGKREYARSLGYRDADMSPDPGSAAPVLLELEEAVRAEPDRAEELLNTLLEKELVLCREVGCGVVPLSSEERRYREAVGRLCVLLAQRAESVVRVVAGLPMALKGELPCVRS